MNFDTLEWDEIDVSSIVYNKILYFQPIYNNKCIIAKAIMPQRENEVAHIFYSFCIFDLVEEKKIVSDTNFDNTDD